MTRPVIAAIGLTLLWLALPRAQTADGILGVVGYDVFSQNAAAPILNTWRGTNVTLGVEDPPKRGPCAAGKLWHAMLVTGGGPYGRDFTRFFWCAYDIGGVMEDDVGFYFMGSNIEPASQWQANTEYGLQFWYRPETTIVGDSNTDPGSAANNKLFMAMKGYSGGDNRVMIHVRRTVPNNEGSTCIRESDEFPNTTHVSIRISRNIDNPRDSGSTLASTLCAGWAIPIGQWSLITASWRMGDQPFVKLWVGANPVYANPTVYDTRTGAWGFDRASLNGEWRAFGGYYSDQLEDTATWGITGLKIWSTFPASGGSGATAPGAPTGLRQRP